MTNYERMQIDKAFCASVMADVDGCGNVIAWEDVFIFAGWKASRF